MQIMKLENEKMIWEIEKGSYGYRIKNQNT